MIEKLLGMLVGYVLCRSSDVLAQFLPTWLTPTQLPPSGGSQPVSYIPKGAAKVSIPSGATPLTVPPGAIPVVAPSAAAFPERLPGGLPPFPGPGWTFAKATPAVVQRAWALLPLLAMGQYKVEPAPDDPNKWLAYRKEPHAQGKTGVTVYTPRAAVVPSPSPSPAAPPMAQSGPIHIPAPGGTIPDWHPEPVPVMNRPAAASPPAVVPSAPPPGAIPIRTLRRGMKGPDVAQWQKIIGAASDGSFGPETEMKTRIWQKSHGLDVDGVVGRKTWASAGATVAA